MRRRWHAVVTTTAALLVTSVALSACDGSGGDGSASPITPVVPLAIDMGSAARVDGPASEGSVAQATELEELLTMQGQRTEARVEEARFWQTSAVIRWNEIARGLVAQYSTSPPNASRVYALLSVAQHDALVRVSALRRTYHRRSPSHADPRITPLFDARADTTYPSDHAAVAAASAAVLSFVYQNRAEVASLSKRAKEHQESRLWAGLGYRSDIEAGDRLGREVAEEIIARAKRDNSRPVLPWNGEVPVGRGLWFSSENPKAAPLRPAWGLVQPWLMASGSQFRPVPPPAFDSPEYRRGLDEVVQISRTRSLEQLRMAQLWADGPSSSTPPGHWNQIASDLLFEQPGSQLKEARVFAFLNMAMMDAGISCWDAKYAYWLIRPSQADPTITTPVGLPNFPSYPSGHSTFSGAAAEVLGHFFPEDRERLTAMAKEASVSRVYGGIHYPFDGVSGLAMGRSIAKLAIAKEERERSATLE